jgi:hypothetical protein
MKIGKLGMFALLLAMIAMAGCTRSLEVKYAGGTDRVDVAQVASAQKITILPFRDDRVWVDKEDEKSVAYVGKQGMWKFGLTFEGKEYVTVSSLLQSLLVTEFRATGFNAVAGSARSVDAGYNLSGRIINFEFENEVGFVTVTSRRVVTIVVSLSDPSGKLVLDNQMFGESERENEGMGVLHTTNADKLINRVLKKVLNDVVARVKVQLAGWGDIQLLVAVNGVVLPEAALSQIVLADDRR